MVVVRGIETSCDETGVAVVKSGRTVLSNVVVSSLREHKKYGGIIPEIASRRQLECIHVFTEEALRKARISLKKVNAIAVTTKPGLIGSLLVGDAFARGLASVLKVPLIEVDHIQAHLYANFLQTSHKKKRLPVLPAIGLVVSGGHTSLFHVDHFHRFKLIGQTRDDAAGETFDKVARILELGYPGGPLIDKLPKKGKEKIVFSCASLPGSFDFSFSGIKTSVLYFHQKNRLASSCSLSDIAASFQKTVVEVLVQKAVDACAHFKCRTLLMGGGVAANSHLRKRLDETARLKKLDVFFPSLDLCLDNGAMIAGLGYQFLN